MKSLTVKDILNLDIMKGCRVAAGSGGLNNSVHYVSVYDNMRTEVDSLIQIFPGDIYLSTLYFGKDNPQYVLEFIQQFIDIKASALLVFDENIKELPPEAIDICNGNDFPVVFVSCEVPYSLVILQIAEYRIFLDQSRSLENKLSALTTNKISHHDKEEIIESINPDFLKNAICFFCNEKDTDSINLLNLINRNAVNYAASYKDGILIIITYNELSDFVLSEHIEDTIGTIHRYRPSAQIGVSDSCPISDLGIAITQGYTAFISKMFDDNGVCRYNDIGVGRILVELNSSSALKDFYQDIMNPIDEYDSHNHAELRKTMLCFAANGMDYKKTSQQLFVHENTIRYRINLIKGLIPFGKSEMDFYETLSIVSKIYMIKSF